MRLLRLMKPLIMEVQLITEALKSDPKAQTTGG